MAQQLHAPLEVREGARLLRPLRRGQDHVRLLRDRGQERVGHDQEAQALERGGDVAQRAVLVVDVVPHQQHRVEAPVAGRGQHRAAARAGSRRHLRAPQSADAGAGLVVRKHVVARQHARPHAHVPRALVVGTVEERHHARARHADIARQQRQVGDGP